MSSHGWRCPGTTRHHRPICRRRREPGSSAGRMTRACPAANRPDGRCAPCDQRRSMTPSDPGRPSRSSCTDPVGRWEERDDGIPRRLHRTVHPRGGDLAIRLSGADAAGAGDALPSREPHPADFGRRLLRVRALPARTRLLHAVPVAAGRGGILRDAPSDSAARSAAVHRRHPNRRGDRAAADRHEHRVLRSPRFHPGSVPPRGACAHGADGVRRVAADRNRAAHRHLPPLPLLLPAVRR